MGCRKFKIQDCFTVKYPDSSACTANLAEGRKAPSDNNDSPRLVSMEGHARRVRISFPKAFLFLIQHLLLRPQQKINIRIILPQIHHTTVLHIPFYYTYNSSKQTKNPITIRKNTPTAIANITTTQKNSNYIQNKFNFRLSSNHIDQETGLVYYNYRYYSPELGRWLSRDPIGERGGLNLYSMTENNPISRVDRLGLKSCESAGGEVKNGICCCGGKEMSPSSQCCEGGSIKSQRTCKAFVFLGHSDNVDKKFVNRIPKTPTVGNTYTCISCKSAANNAAIKKSYPDHVIPKLPFMNDNNLKTWDEMNQMFQKLL